MGVFDTIRCNRRALVKLGVATSAIGVGAAFPALIPVAGAAVGALAGDVGTDLLASVIDRFLRDDDPVPDKLNHDVELAVGHAIERILQERIDAGSPHAAAYQAMLRAETAKLWRRMLIKEEFDLPLPDPQGLMVRAAEIERARREGEVDPDKVPAFPPALDIDTWKSWLDLVSLECNVLLPTDALAELAPALVDRFYWHLFEVLKDDFANDGKAYAAIQLNSTQSILAIVQASAIQIDRIEEIVSKILEKLAAIAPAEAKTNRCTVPKLPDSNVRRSTQLREIHDRLTRGDAGLIPAAAAHGGGGYGKSYLALDYAHHPNYAPAYPGGRHYLALSNRSLAEALAELGRQIHIPGLPTETDDAARATVEHLAAIPEPVLLVIDNAEQQHVDEHLRKVLPDGNVHRLYTTRLPNLLPAPQCVTVGRLSDEEALELFAKFCGQDRVDAAHTAALRIHTLLEGVALGVAAAAAYLGHADQVGDVTFAGYADDLEQLTPDAYPDGDESLRHLIGYSSRLVKTLDDAVGTLSDGARLALR